MILQTYYYKDVSSLGRHWCFDPPCIPLQNLLLHVPCRSMGLPVRLNTIDPPARLWGKFLIQTQLPIEPYTPPGSSSDSQDECMTEGRLITTLLEMNSETGQWKFPFHWDCLFETMKLEDCWGLASWEYRGERSFKEKNNDNTQREAKMIETKQEKD